MRLAPLLTHPVITVLRYLLSLALVAGLLAWVDWTQFAGLESYVHLGWTVAGLLLAGLAYVFHAARFRVLMALQELPISRARAGLITLVGQFYNAFLPTGIGGDLIRLHHVFLLHPGGKAGGATAVLVDRLLGFGSLLLLGVLALAAHAWWSPVTATAVGQWGAPLAGATLVFVAVFIVSVRLPPARWPGWFTGGLERVLGADRWITVSTAHQRAIAQPRRQAAAWSWSVLVWLAEFSSAYALARAAGLEVTTTALVLAVVVANLAAVLPLGIGGHGVREGALLAALALAEADPGLMQTNPALVFALLFLAANLFWSAAGGLLTLGPWARSTPRTPSLPS